jgi:hypothetical protein
MRPSSKDKSHMSTAIDSTARQWAMRLEEQEVSNKGVPLPAARAALARRLGVAPGTLENIRRGRTKGVRGWIVEALRNAMIRQIQSEMTRLSHELEIIRQGGARPDADEILEVQTALAAARQLIEETR